MKKIITQALKVLLHCMFFLFIYEISFSQTKEFIGRNMGQSYQEYINKYLKKYSVYELDIEEISTYVNRNSQKAQFTLSIGSEQFILAIEVNDMRGENFKAEVTTEKGKVELTQTFADTYKGFANNNLSNTVRLTINESTFEGYINIYERWIHFDKLSRYYSNASKNQIVIYEAMDVISNNNYICGADMLKKTNEEFQNEINPENLTSTGNCHFAQIATEADYEYFQNYSSSANAALSNIRSILNQVEGFYTSSFDVKFILRYQHIWSTTSDPYSGTILDDILIQFANEWNTNYTGISRDVTHMFTGRTVTNSTVGLAFVSEVCDTTYYYGVVVDYSPISNATISLSAHELGHNFGAYHDTTLTGQPLCNGSNIMCPFIQSGNPTWSTQSTTEIPNYINSVSCLTESFSTNEVLSPFPGQPWSFLKKIASNNITINSTFGAVILASSGFGYIEAGSSIVIEPTVSGTVGFHATQGSTLRMRISDVINSCDQQFENKATAITSYIPSHGTFTVYPNPFSEEINMKFNLEKENHVTIELTDITGRVLDKILNTALLPKGDQLFKYNTSYLSGGMYLISITTDRERIVKSIMKTN